MLQKNRLKLIPFVNIYTFVNFHLKMRRAKKEPRAFFAITSAHGQVRSLFWQEIAGGELGTRRDDGSERWKWLWLWWRAGRDRPAVSKAHRGAVEQGQCFHHCRSFFHSSCRRWTALSPFTLFWPQRIHCRRVVGGYRQPVGINVSTRQGLGDGWVL